MGKFNELLPGRYNEGISAVLGLSEQEGVRTVSPELMPVFVMEREKPEHAYPKKERLCAGGGLQAADVANFSSVALINPLGSDMLVILEKYAVSSLLASVYNVGPTNSALVLAFAGGVTNFVRDTRWTLVGTGSSAAIVRSGVLAAGQGSFSRRMPANHTLDFAEEYVLAPGFAFIVNTTAINTPVQADFTWRERKVLPEER